MSVEQHFNVAKFNLHAIKQAVGRAEGVTAKIAVITRAESARWRAPTSSA